MHELYSEADIKTHIETDLIRDTSYTVKYIGKMTGTYSELHTETDRDKRGGVCKWMAMERNAWMRMNKLYLGH